MSIAVILISYNQEQYIVEALNGILCQSVQADEVIIADDCSSDRTQFLISEYVNKHELKNKWNLLFNSKNLGINGNLQNAINHTTAEIIIPMAGDDISLSNRCEHAIELFQKHSNLSIVTTSFYRVDSKGNPMGVFRYKDELRNNIEDTIKKGMPDVSPVGQAWKRTMFEVFGDLPMNVPNEDDQITFWGLLAGGIFCSKQITVKYREHSGSACSWLRKDLSNNDYFSRFMLDMPIRRRHMELWKKSIQCINREDPVVLCGLLDKKIELYSFLENITCYSFCDRLRFLWSHYSVTGLREKYYILGGKFGILNWRSVKKILGKI